MLGVLFWALHCTALFKITFGPHFRAIYVVEFPHDLGFSVKTPFILAALAHKSQKK